MGGQAWGQGGRDSSIFSPLFTKALLAIDPASTLNLSFMNSDDENGLKKGASFFPVAIATRIWDWHWN